MGQIHQTQTPNSYNESGFDDQTSERWIFHGAIAEGTDRVATPKLFPKLVAYFPRVLIFVEWATQFEW